MYKSHKGINYDVKVKESIFSFVIRNSIHPMPPCKSCDFYFYLY